MHCKVVCDALQSHEFIYCLVCENSIRICICRCVKRLIHCALVLDAVNFIVLMSVNCLLSAAPPAIAVSRQSRIVPLGSRVALTCQAQGNPPPYIKWSKRGGDLPRSGFS